MLSTNRSNRPKTNVGPTQNEPWIPLMPDWKKLWTSADTIMVENPSRIEGEGDHRAWGDGCVGGYRTGPECYARTGGATRQGFSPLGPGNSAISGGWLGYEQVPVKLLELTDLKPSKTFSDGKKYSSGRKLEDHIGNGDRNGRSRGEIWFNSRRGDGVGGGRPFIRGVQEALPLSDSHKSQQLSTLVLTKLLCESAEAIVKALVADNQSALKQILIQADASSENICSVIKVLSKAVTSNHGRQELVELFTTVFSEPFLSKLLKFHCNMCSTLSQGKLIEFLHHQHQFLSRYFKLISPNFSSRFADLLQIIRSTLWNRVKRHALRELFDVFKLYDRLLLQINQYLELLKKETGNDDGNILSNKLSAMDFREPEEDFRDLTTEPTYCDIMSSKKPFVRRNIVIGQYADVHTYLDIQFRLFREDFIRPLREGIQDYIHDTSSGNRNVRIYTDVRILQVDISHGKYVYSLQLNLSKKFNQETSKRLMGGNLICASDDNFATFFLALIADQQDDLRQGILDICPLSRVKINFSSTYTVIESTAFFVAYKHVLAALQQISRDSFPLAEHIVYAQKRVELPHYLQGRKDSVYDMTVVLDTSFMKTSKPNGIFDRPTSCVPPKNPQMDRVSVTVGITGWPSCESLKLDQSQFAALHAALTSRLAIIQGPPGTGKTFLGLKIVQTLLHNSETWATSEPIESKSGTQLSVHEGKVSTSQPPILVVCYTNHALDQFLEGMQNFTKKIVRIGGRSKNEEIKKFQVNEIIKKLKSAKKLPGHLVRASSSLHRNFCHVEYRFEKLQMQLFRLVNCEGLLRWSFLLENGLIPSHIANQLSEFTYRDWILPKDEVLTQTTPRTPLSNWDDNSASTKNTNGNVGKTVEQIWDPASLASHHEQTLAIGDHPPAKHFAADYVQPNAAIFDLVADTVAEQLEVFNDQIKSAIPSSGYEWHKTQLESQIFCIKRLTRVSKVDVHSLKLNENQNILELCFQDRCLLYTKWKQNLEMFYQEQLNKLQCDSQAFLMKPANLIDLSKCKRELQENLSGIRNLEGVIKWDIFISSGVVPLPIAKQFSRHTYLSWILPHDPEIRREITLSPMWTVWHNTPDLKKEFPGTLDIDAWREKMITARYESSASLYEYSNLDDFKISSDDVEYEVHLGNYDEKLAELNYTLGQTLPRNCFEALTNKIRSEQECLRLVLSVSNDNAYRPIFRRNINVHELSFKDRCLLHESWKQNLICKYQDLCRPYEITVRQLTARMDEIKRARYLHVASQANVVGMTTTGAAEYRSMIQELRPKIVVIEEAAEILEAHVVTALAESCEHLIMIGDHQQLRPSPSVYELATKYGLDTSLFERMIKNGIQFKTLEYQHRMRPEISRLLVPSIYPKLKDHESVKLKPTVKGISTSVFFVTHHHKEEKECDDNKSRSNAHEADYIMQLARHLVLQGYSTDQITVLTPYSGQFFLLKQKLRELEECRGMHVTIVDNYQGEENDIILLSLVRSNDRGNIGFLSIDNRVCVALSRAKQGLYIIGNLDQLCEASPLWVKIKESLAETKSVGETLTLYCQNHPDQVSYVKTAEEFKEFSPEGGCTKPCLSTLPQCGHPCPRKCHANDPNHENAECLLPCRKKCKFGIHDCKGMCCKPCPPCLEEVNVELPCKHMQGIECHISIAHDIKCSTVVEKEIFHCKHVVKTLCSNNPLTVKCTIPCSTKLDCGHDCERPCHVLEDPEHKKYKCKAPCSRPSKPCTHNHVCPMKCYEKCLPCVEMVTKKASCGHSVLVECNLKMEEYKCKMPCEHVLKCGHSCTRTCSEECSPCLIKVNKEAKCGHSALVGCNLNMEEYKCKLPCKVSLACGHKCPCKCWEVCGSCKVKVQKIHPSCGHSFIVNCGYDSGNLVCREPCNRLLECEHKCTRRCDSDCGNCQQIVEKTLPKCGHKVKLPCSTSLVHFQCEMLCTRVLKCKHLCPRKCFSTCGGCRVLVEKTIPTCGHKALVPCESDLTKIQCKFNCQRLSSCKEEKCTCKRSNECCGCNELSQKTLPHLVHKSKIVLETGTNTFQCNMMYGRPLDFEPQCHRKCNEGSCNSPVAEEKNAPEISYSSERPNNSGEENIFSRQQHKLLLEYDDSCPCKSRETSVVCKNTEGIVEKCLPSYNRTIKIECLMSTRPLSCNCVNTCTPSHVSTRDPLCDYPRDVLGDHPRDMHHDNSYDRNLNYSRNVHRELSRDLSQDLSHDINQDHSRDINQDHSRDINQDHSRDINQDHSRDINQDHSRDINQDHSRDINRDHSRDINQDHSRDINRDHSRDINRDHSRDINQDHSRDINQDLSRDINQDLSRDINQDLSRDINHGLSRDIHQIFSRDLHHNLSRGLHQDLSGDLHQDLSGDLHQDLSGDLHQDLSGDLHQDLSGDLHQDLSGDLHQDPSGDLHQNQYRDLHQDNYFRLRQDHARDVPEDVSNNITRDKMKHLFQKHFRKVHNDESCDLPLDESIDRLSDVSHDLSSEALRDLTNEVSRDLSNDISLDLSNEVSRDLSSVASRDLSSVVSRDLSSVASRDLSSVASRDLSSVASRDLSSVASRDLSSVASRDLSSVVSRDLSSVVSRDLSSVASRDLSSVASRDLSSVASRDLSSVASRDLSSVASRDLSSVASRDLSSVASRDLSSVASRDLSSVASRDLSSVASRDLSSVASRDLSSNASNQLSSNAARSMMKHTLHSLRTYRTHNLSGDHVPFPSGDQFTNQLRYSAYDLTNDQSIEPSRNLPSDGANPNELPHYLLGHQGPDQHGDPPGYPDECAVELECGHKCGGSRDICHQGRLHQPCLQPCQRSLLCGHRCPGLCGEPCLRCSERCPRRCRHDRCASKCGDPCTKCTFKCGSRCSHTLGCGKDCDECKCVPCALVCPKTLPCGHACVGYCGDPCPSLCRVCDEDQLQNSCLREMAPEELAVARFVLLPDCGHIVEHDGLQASLSKRDHVVCSKRCPLGQEPVYNCHRFEKTFRETYKNLQLISEDCANDFMDMDSIANQLIDPTTANLDECFLSWQYLRASPLLTAVSSCKSGGKKTFSRQQLSDFHFQAVFFKEVKALHEELVDNLNLNVELTQLRKKVLQETSIASSQFRHEVSCELQRIAILSSVDTVRRRALPKLEPFLAAIDLHLDPFKAFTPEREWHVRRLLKNCQNIIPDLKIIENRRMESDVLSVKMFCERVWSVCPNGHVQYSNTEGIHKETPCLICSKC